MRRPSTIDKLGPEIRDLIGQLRDNGRSIDAILEHLRKLLPDDDVPSRSALGRHLQKIEVIAERMRQSRVVADTLVRQLGDEPADKSTRLNIELMHSVIFDIVTASQAGGENEGQPVTFDPEQVMFLAKSLDHLGKAAVADVQRIEKIEKRAAEKAQKEAAARVEKVAREKGLSEDTLAAIRSGIFGVS